MKDLINAVTGTEIASVLEATNTHKHSRIVPTMWHNSSPEKY